MRHLSKTTIFLLLFMFSVGSVSALAQTEPNDADHGKDRKECNKGHEKHADIPNLTEEQKTQIEAIRDEFKTENHTTMSELREKQQELRQLKSADSVNIEAVDSLIDEIGVLKTSIMKSKTNMDLEVRNLLTEDQRTYFDSRPLHSHKHKRG
jgi:Spy/CpxP family protein refolding chaperone